MATITLDYNARNQHAQRALDYILSLGYFKAQADRRRRTHPAVNTSRINSADPFAGVRGIWADREVDAKVLRTNTWERGNS